MSCWVWSVGPFDQEVDGSICDSYPPSPTSTSASSSANSETPAVSSNRRSIHDAARFTSARDLKELDTMHTTGGSGVEADVPPEIMLEQPPTNLSTQSFLIMGNSRNPASGMLPMDRFLSMPKDKFLDEAPVRLFSLPLPTPFPAWKLPLRGKPLPRITSPPGKPSGQSAPLDLSRDGSPQTWRSKASQGEPAAQAHLEAERRISGGQPSPPEKQDGPFSNIVQSSYGKGQSSSGPSGNAISRGKAGANCTKGGGRIGGGRANDNTAPQDGDGAASNSGNDPSKERNGQLNQTVGPEWLVGCILQFMKRGKACDSNGFKNAARMCRHLVDAHGFETSPCTLCLYLVEPKDNDAKDPNRRRGLCRVCYQVFDYWKREPCDQNEKLMDTEDVFLFQHVELHKRDNPNVKPDNQEKSHVKEQVLKLAFRERLSIKEIDRYCKIPFSNPKKAPIVEPRVPSTINTPRPTSFAGHDHDIHTAPGSDSGSSLKRPFALMEEGGIPTVALLAPSQPLMSTSSGSSQGFPSTIDFSGFPSSDSSPPLSIDQTPEHTTLFPPNVPTSTSAPASQGFDPGNFNGVTQSAHAVQDNDSPSRDSLPNRDPIFAKFGQQVIFGDGQTATFEEDYTYSISYNPTHDQFLQKILNSTAADQNMSQ